MSHSSTYPRPYFLTEVTLLQRSFREVCSVLISAFPRAGPETFSFSLLLSYAIIGKMGGREEEDLRQLLLLLLPVHRMMALLGCWCILA